MAIIDVNAIVQYEGKVVHKGTTTPYPDLEVKITNGDKIHTVDHTDTSGNFTLNVRVNEIDGSYYVLVGDSSCITKRVELSGYGQTKVNLGTIEIEGPSLPTVSTRAISDISDTKATCGGNVTQDGRSQVTARGVCWSKTKYPTINDDHTQNGSGLGEFTSQITGLEAGVTYYVRAYATNRIGTAYGEQRQFTTSTGMPSVTTDEVSDITATTAKCEGNVTSGSGYAITARGICWSDKSASPTLNNDFTEEVAAIGKFSSMLIGLEPNKTYYVRAYATNARGTNYGETKTFTTLNGLPTVITSTDSRDNVTYNNIITGGNVADDGGFSIIERGIVYSTLPYPDLTSATRIACGNGTGYFSANIINISPSIETYYIRAYATNANGTAYGNQETIGPDNYAYCTLTKMTYGGYTYRIKPLGGMTWQEGYDACEDMAYGGYNDWFMPNVGEVEAILRAYGVWNVEVWKEADIYQLKIHSNTNIWTSSSNNSGDYHYYSIWKGYGASPYKWHLDGEYNSGRSGDNIYEVIAVRKYIK